MSDTPMTDTPAGEPRTNAGRALQKGEIFDLTIEEDRRRLALAIEHEAAQSSVEWLCPDCHGKKDAKSPVAAP